MVGWRKSRNSNPVRGRHKKTWREVIRLGSGLPDDGPNWNASFRQESFEWYISSRQTEPNPIFGINYTQYKQNSDDDDDGDDDNDDDDDDDEEEEEEEEDDDYDDDDVPMMMMMLVVILNIYFVLSLAVS